jgi:hypothetical protein
MLKRIAAPFLMLLIPACGGSSDPQTLLDEGGRALNSGQYETAAERYSAALAAIDDDPSRPEWLRAKLGWILAQTRIDAARAKEEFLALAAAHSSKIQDKDFNQVASRLGDADRLPEAIEVLTAGMAAHPESPHLQVLRDDLGKKAEDSNSAGALDALKGLGYVGD